MTRVLFILEMITRLSCIALALLCFAASWFDWPLKPGLVWLGAAWAFILAARWNPLFWEGPWIP